MANFHLYSIIRKKKYTKPTCTCQDFRNWAHIVSNGNAIKQHLGETGFSDHILLKNLPV